MNKILLSKRAPTILTLLGVIGVGVTAVMSARAAPKAKLLLDSARKEKGEDLTVIEKVNEVGVVYLPAVITGAATVTCILGANIFNKRQQASLMSAYALLNEYHKEYRNKLIEIYGEEADVEIRDAMARGHCNYHQIGLDVPDEKVIFYDEISGESVVCYEREIMDAEYHINRNFVMRGYAPLNEFYEFLGLPTTDYGDSVGWSMSYGYSWIDFEHRLISRDDGGVPIYSIDMVFAPDADYLRDWAW